MTSAVLWWCIAALLMLWLVATNEGAGANGAKE
jgi:hypothetical protein